MKRSYLIWSLTAAALIFGPAGVRMLTWQRTKSQPVDTEMAKAGEVLFNHVWKSNDPLSPEGDGIGPVFNANSCVACHNQGGVGGGGKNDHNVTTFVVRSPDGKKVVREGV